MSEEKKSGLGVVILMIVTIGVSLVLGWVASGLWTGISMKKQKAMMAAMAQARAGALTTVAVTNAVSREYNLPERYVAHVEAMSEVDLVPQVDGYIKEIKFNEGDTVREGQLLYVLDDEKYLAIVGQAKADLAAAEAEERRAVRYNERMVTADDRGVTQLERDNAFAAAEKAKAAVMQAKANLVVAEYNCKKAKVIAPISGKIGKTAVHVGDLVSPSRVLAHIVQFDPIRVSFPLTDRAYLEAQQRRNSGHEADIRTRLVLPNGAEYDRTGVLDFDDNAMSKDTATIIVRLRFANPDRMLIPNSYVNVLSDYLVPPKYLSLPQQCVIDLVGGNRGVWVVKSDMTVEQRAVETKETFDGWTPIVSGITAEDKVVMSGSGKLGTGMKVAFVEPTSNDDINPNHVAPIKE